MILVENFTDIATQFMVGKLLIFPCWRKRPVRERKVMETKKAPDFSEAFYLVAGTGLEPVSAAADMSPTSY